MKLFVTEKPFLNKLIGEKLKVAYDKQTPLVLKQKKINNIGKWIP
jgi:hypothetical protein